MKQIEFKPMNMSSEIIVQYTDNFILDKSMKISVPNQYIAIVFDNEKISFRVDPCVGKTIFKEYGKNFIGHTMKIAFIRVAAIPEMPWGFGNIQVKNERLKEAYRVGTNGTIKIKITDYAKLMASFSNDVAINIDDIKDKVTAIIKMIGAKVVSSHFANTDVSIFEINSLISDIRDEMLEKIEKESKLVDLGIEMSSLVISGIHVPEEDLERIRNRINVDKAPTSVKIIEKYDDEKIDRLREDVQKMHSEILGKISEEIAESEARSKNENEKTINEKIDSNRSETVSTVIQYVNDQLDEFGKSLAFELDEKMQDMLPLREGAKEENFTSLDLTAENIINNAKCDDDFVPAAAIIHSNVEDNLIHKFDLPHEKEKFLIDFNDYLKVAEQAKIGDRYLLKRRNEDGTFRTFMPRVYKKDKNGEPLIAEALPVVRFIQAGLSVEKAWKASEMWTVLNQIRHKSDENKDKLNSLFSKEKQTQKDYLLSVLKFFKENGLYTKD